jgi:CheY-like chemotaxis protein
MDLSPGEAMQAQPSYRQSILLVEDSADSREMLRLLLEDLNYFVWEAKGADEAFKMLLSHPPDLILTDFGLPDVDGIELTRKVRGLGDRRSQLPIVMLTAFDLDDYYQSAIKAGCSAFLTKPVDFPTLESVISRLIRNYRGEKDSESIPNESK